MKTIRRYELGGRELEIYFSNYFYTAISFIVIACSIVLVFLGRKYMGKGKECSENSVAQHDMDDKDKKPDHRIIPHTERKATGQNWELLKNLVISSPSIETSAVGKENVQKKPAPHQQKSWKKHHAKMLNTDRVKLIANKEPLDESKKALTKHIAMDCEMVGIGDGFKSMLARVSIVNRHGYCVYDKYVKPREPVLDYRTEVSGIRPHNLQNGETFKIVQKEVAEILKGRVLIGHALKHDLDVLYLSHPRKHLRDTSKFKTFRQLSKGNTPSLKKLASELLGKKIQSGEHSSIEDAVVAMQLYMLYKSKWESELYSKR